ncbi:hypothetical protein [Brachybacterium sp. AOP3-A1-3]|uniref:hypothetical protein n=1 Tax=Brachybacterium sp. AOP3-A1-3 TaxID=3457699 RepID=UPI004033A17F
MTRRADHRGPLSALLAASLVLVGGSLLVGGPVLVAAPTAALADPTPDAELPAYAYAADGEQVEGGGSLAQAVAVAPGIHLDSFAQGAQEEFGDGTTKYYRVTVEDGQRVRTAATIAAPPYPDGLPEGYEGLDLRISYLTAGGDSCDDGGASSSGATMTGDGPITTSAISGAVGPDGCTGTELFVQVTRTGLRAADEPLPVEIQVAIQPSGIGGGSPSVDEEIEDDGASPVAPTTDEPIELGRSFASATPLEPGSYVVELVPGESGLVRIPVQEGQRLRWRTEITSQPEGAGELSLLAFNAARETVTVGGGSWQLSDYDSIVGGGMSAPVDRGNRSSELSGVQSAWLPGTHTIQLHRLQRAAGADPAGDEPVTLILTLEVEGDVAADAADGTVLELGDTTSGSSPGGFLGLDGALGRVALFVAAGLLTLMAAVTGVAGVLVLRLRRR